MTSASTPFLKTLTDSASKLQARLTENLAESSRELGITQIIPGLDLGVGSIGNGAGSGGAKYFDGVQLTGNEAERETRKLLESKGEKEREEGLKRVLAMMAKSLPTLSFFPQVTNCLLPSVVNPSLGPGPQSSSSAQTPLSLSIRSLVSLYILRHAHLAPDLALLSVNTYQKDLSDSNPIVRGLAIETLSGMMGVSGSEDDDEEDEEEEDGIYRGSEKSSAVPGVRGEKRGVEGLEPLVLMSVKKSVRDGSWYVRRKASEALIRLYRLDASQTSSIIPPLQSLLSDTSPLSLPSALHAFTSICHSRWELIHPHYRRICSSILDMDEWGQVLTIKLLVKYARDNFVDPNTLVESVDVKKPAQDSGIDPDLDLLLRCVEPLFQSRNPAVTMLVIKLFHYIAPATRYIKIVRPLLRLLNTPQETCQMVLEDVAIIAEQRRELMSPYYLEFLVKSSDSEHVKRLKLRILSSLADQGNANFILREFIEYVRDPVDDFVVEAIGAIGDLAVRIPQSAEDCMRSLINLLRSKNDAVVSKTVEVLRTLLRRLPTTGTSTFNRDSVIRRLVKLMNQGKIKAASARATFFWLLGQYADQGLASGLGPDMLRKAAKEFAEESPMAKLQILTLSAKLLSLSHLSALAPHHRPLTLLFQYVTTSARFDLNYEVRDRSRFLVGLLSSAGIGKTEKPKIMMGLDDFSRGQQAYFQEDASGRNSPVQTEEKPTLTGEQVRIILFEGKGGPDDKTTKEGRSGNLCTLSGVVGKRLAGFGPLPNWAKQRSDPSLRNDTSSAISAPSAVSSATRPPPVLRGFGSESFGPNLGPRSVSGGKASPIVLTPGGSGSASPAAGAAGKGGFRDLDDFLASEESESADEEGEDEDEDSADDDDDDDQEGDDDEDEEEEEGYEDEGGENRETGTTRAPT